MKSGIYKIYNKKADKYYIGQSVNVDNRLVQHKGELNKGIHINNKLQDDWHKYGEKSFVFEKIHSCEEEFLNAMERYFMDKYDVLQNGYNIASVNNFVRSEVRKKLIMEKDFIKNKKLENIEIELTKEEIESIKLCKKTLGVTFEFIQNLEIHHSESAKLGQEIFDLSYGIQKIIIGIEDKIKNLIVQKVDGINKVDIVMCNVDCKGEKFQIRLGDINAEGNYYIKKLVI